MDGRSIGFTRTGVTGWGMARCLVRSTGGIAPECTWSKAEEVAREAAQVADSPAQAAIEDRVECTSGHP